MDRFKNISGIFFLSILGVVLYLCYLIFKPFLGIIFVAGAFTVTLHDPYLKLLKFFNNRKNLASAIMCLGILFVIIIPLFVFLFFLSKSGIEAYSSLSNNFNSTRITELANNTFSTFHIDIAKISSQLGSIFTEINKFIINGIAVFLKSTSELVAKLFIMLLTIFFLFRDGKSLLERIIRLTPLSDNYDREIFAKFKEVSYSALVSTIITGFAQGIVAGIGYVIVGVPVFLFSISTAFASLIPFVGAGLVWLPVSIYLAFTGQWWQALFILFWGIVVISLIDNILRPMLMKGKTNIHPMILFFSIFGGIIFFGFWGIIFGPLLISIALTLLHIYEVEYCGILDGCSDIKIKKKKSIKE